MVRSERTIYKITEHLVLFGRMDLFGKNTSDTIFTRGMARLEQMVLLVEVVLTMQNTLNGKTETNEDRVGLTVKLDGNKIVLSRQ